MLGFTALASTPLVDDSAITVYNLDSNDIVAASSVSTPIVAHI